MSGIRVHVPADPIAEVVEDRVEEPDVVTQGGIDDGDQAGRTVVRRRWCRCRCTGWDNRTTMR